MFSDIGTAAAAAFAGSVPFCWQQNSSVGGGLLSRALALPIVNRSMPDGRTGSPHRGPRPGAHKSRVGN